MAVTKKGLGRGLSALIPDSDMEFLSRVARGDTSLPAVPIIDEAIGHKVTSGTDRGADTDVSTPATTTPMGAGTHMAKARLSTQEAANALSTTGEQTPSLVSADPATGTATGAVARPGTVGNDTPLWLDVQSIEANPYQPRRVFADEEMRDLIASVREHGIIQPVLVRPLPDHAGQQPRYQLIAGERRWRASQEAGLAKVPAVVRQVSDQQALELALIENVQRHDISAMDAAKAYRRLADEFGLSQEDIAKRVGKSRPAIANTMRLLDLPEEAQQAIEDGAITEGHGRAILLAPGDGARRAVFRRILRDKVTVREAEELSRKAQSTREDGVVDDSAATANAGSLGAKQTRMTPVELRALRSTEEELSKLLGTRVRVRARAKGGQICIEYFSPDDLDHLLGRLRGK